MICVNISLLIFPQETKAYAYEGLKLCAESVIPSLFPFSVLSSLFMTSPVFSDAVGHFPLCKLFGLPSCSSGPILLGYLFGFPIGAKCAVDLYKNGKIKKEQAEVLIAVSNNSGPAFIVSVIGTSFYNDTVFGIKLYFLQILSSLAAGILINKLILPVSSKYSHNNTKDSIPFSVRLTSAITGSASASLNIAAYVCSFSIIGGIIKAISSNHTVNTIIMSFLEITSAARDAVRINSYAGNAICAFAVGFSGLSVIMQAASFAVPEGISVKRLFFTKLTQGIICTVCSPCICRKTTAAVFLYSDAASLNCYITAGIITAYIIKIIILQYKIKKSLDL